MAKPTLYKPEYDDIALEYVGEQGKSIIQLARHLRVCRATIYLWVNANPSFKAALSLAKDWAEAEWEDRYQGYMVDPKVNAALVGLYFANRFKWTSKPSDAKHEFKFIEGAKPLENAEHIFGAASRGEIPTSVAINYISAIRSVIEIEQAGEVKARLEEIEKALNLGGN